jgi:acyl-CoA hydrolase
MPTETALSTPASPHAAPVAARRAVRDELELTELILPQHANHYGTLFGPNALALLGKAAFLVCARYTCQPVVMAAAKQVDFLAPIPVGSLVNVGARIARVGRASMTVHVAARFDGPRHADAGDLLRAEFEMVTVDPLGRPCRVSPPDSTDPIDPH